MKYQVQLWLRTITNPTPDYVGVYRGNSIVRVLGWWVWASRKGVRVKVIRMGSDDLV